MKKLLDIDKINEAHESRVDRGRKGGFARWTNHREREREADWFGLNKNGDMEARRETVLRHILNQIYFVKWQDNELRDVWNIVTTLKKLGATT